ncbi:MAG: bifunctional DNA primase/polymerase [Candidatus Gastranaerophilales bacterium]|nr:bifunctional DNA primase/polymerase [Candidatus Gastranaerophilales bacterium]
MQNNALEKIVLSIDELAFFKVKPNDKQPACRNGFHDAKVGFDIVGTFAQGYNVGFAMESNGLIALDMDEDSEKGYEGIKVIQELEKELGALPLTYTQKTPRGGLHKVFLAKGLENKPTGKITPAVDVKFSGYILFHGSRVKGKYYQAIDGVTADGKLIFSELQAEWLNYIASSSKLNKSDKKSPFNDYKPVSIDGDFKQMYDNCPFVKECVDESMTLSENEWHMFARLLNNFSNGEELFDMYSKNHREYSQSATKKKFLYAKKYPVDCISISAVSKVCKNCGNKLK